MLLRQDSLTIQQGSSVSETDSVSHKTARPQTPYQVLRMLPKDATPAQQDSAVQSWFQPDEIHYSSQPDTLHLPGHSKGRSWKDISLPQYYKETFFATSSMFHPEIEGGQYGVAGEPLPYTVRNDNLITSMLLGCFLLMLFVYAHFHRFIARQYRDLFLIPHGMDSVFTETSGELRIKILLCLQTFLLGAVFVYFLTKEYVGDTFIVSSDYVLIFIFFGLLLGYMLFKMLAYTMVNYVFFDGKRNGQFLRSLLLLVATQGILFYPVVLLLVYFDLPIQTVVYYFLVVLFLGKIVVFYRAYVIFFRQNVFLLQIFLYFCALEIVPVLFLWEALTITADSLKINF